MVLITIDILTIPKSLSLARFFPKPHTYGSICLMEISLVSHRPFRLHISKRNLLVMPPQISCSLTHDLLCSFFLRTVPKYTQASQGRNLMVTFTPSLLFSPNSTHLKGLSILPPKRPSCLLLSPVRITYIHTLSLITFSVDFLTVTSASTLNPFL